MRATALSHQQQTSKEFSTRDIYLASTIKQAGVPILRVEGNGGRGIFVFKHSEKIEPLIAKYFNGELLVDAKGLFETWKSLKSMAFASIGDVR
ncbi:MAG: hypothetical protein HZA00_10515 [Nitrospinae bacterium]|nr:hypothetical protein [Nitrospinota bacterium]